MSEQSWFVRSAHWLLRMCGIDGASDILATLVMVVIAAILSFAIYLTFKELLIQTVWRIVLRTKNKKDDRLLSKDVLRRIALVLCIIPLLAFGRAMPADNWLSTFYMKFVYIYMAWSLGLLLNELVDAIFDLTDKTQSLGGLRRIIKYAIYIVIVVILLAVLLDKNPVKLVAGLGASAAIISLVFKDTIQSLVAGIHLLTNNMVKYGDWIVVPKAHANGKVIAMDLNTVKIRNWDNTITTVPPSTLLSDSFTSWEGMRNGSGRRISRSLCIDMASVRFMSEDELANYKEEFPELHIFFEFHDEDGPRVTNLTLFRHYMYQYLLNDNQIQLEYCKTDAEDDEENSGVEMTEEEKKKEEERTKREKETEMRVMVRYLQPTQYGLPVELYCFTKTKKWEAHEDVIAELTEHMLGVMQRFDLRPYQVVNGNVEKTAQPRTSGAQTVFPSMRQGSNFKKVSPAMRLSHGRAFFLFLAKHGNESWPNMEVKVGQMGKFSAHIHLPHQ